MIELLLDTFTLLFFLWIYYCIGGVYLLVCVFMNSYFKKLWSER